MKNSLVIILCCFLLGAAANAESINIKSKNISLDKITNINVKFHKRRLTEDQDLFVREGDFVRYGSIYYEIVKLTEPKLLFGQAEFRFEIQATCVRARDGLFNAT